MGYEKKISVDITGELAEHVAATVGDHGFYETATEYVRDLIRRDIERDRRDFEAYKAELREAFAVADSDCIEITGDEFLAQMRERHG